VIDYVCLPEFYFHFCKPISRKQRRGENRRYVTRYVIDSVCYTDVTYFRVSGQC